MCALLLAATAIRAHAADTAIVYQPRTAPLESPAPIPASDGPHLFLDERLILRQENLERAVRQPRRDPAIPNPVVTGPEDGCFQPYLTVLRDAATGKFRIWYGRRTDELNNNRSRLATIESDDGIHFKRPHRVCQTPEIQFGVSVIDRGASHPDPSARYANGYHLNGALLAMVSPDGYDWRPISDGRLIEHDHDIAGIDWDARRKTYAATISFYIDGQGWDGRRRTTKMSFSPDLLKWEDPWFVLTADRKLDEGDTQFYAMDGYLNRGPLRIGMVKVLRDDLKAEGTSPDAYGRAHTSLAWSLDGRSWTRDRAPFFEPDADPASWDHAHAWIDEQLIFGDEVYLYYGGYKQGHKVNRYEERQIGLVKIPLDRYVARKASGATPGRLETIPILLDLDAPALRINASIANAGSIRVRAADPATGETLPGFGFEDCRPIAGDGLQLPAEWTTAKLADLAGRTIRLEFELRAADLYAFEFSGTPRAGRR